MEQQLMKNFLKIQDKIEEIFNCEELHIKQIADLDRYIDMQRKIYQAIMSSKKGDK